METSKIFMKNLYFFVDMLKNEGFRFKISDIRQFVVCSL